MGRGYKDHEQEGRALFVRASSPHSQGVTWVQSRKETYVPCARYASYLGTEAASVPGAILGPIQVGFSST